MPEKTYVPIIGATIKLFYPDDDMNLDTPIQTFAPVASDPGNYKGETIYEGDYFLHIAADGRGSVIHPFTLPNPVKPEELIKYIGPINMVAGLPVLEVDVINMNAEEVTTDITLYAAKLLGTHTGLGNYEVTNVPVGTQMIEIVPDNPDQYQNLKILRDIVNPMGPIAITLYPPVTLNITVRSGRVSNNTIDPTCRLFEMSGNTKVREFQREGNIFPIRRLADGTITVRAFEPDGTSPLGDAQTYNIWYTNTEGTGVLNRSYYYVTWSDLYVEQ